MAKKREYNLFTFVAGDALQEGRTFHIRCNCGGQAPLTPPFSTEFVVCPKCLALIKFLVLEGDPGYVVGQTPQGEPMLIPVQGSAAKLVSQLSELERKEILDNIRRMTDPRPGTHPKTDS